MDTAFENDVYGVLGLGRSATGEEVRDAYRRRAFETHPDRSAGCGAEFLAVAEAYRILSDPARRTAYDAAHPAPASLARVEPAPSDVPFGDAAADRATAPDPAPAGGADVADEPWADATPVADAARSLFEYLTDVVRRMILEGSAPDEIIASLRAEGCPESVASALERDLRAALRPPAPSRRVARHRRLAVGLAAGAAAVLAASVAVALVHPSAEAGFTSPAGAAVAPPPAEAVISPPPAAPASPTRRAATPTSTPRARPARQEPRPALATTGASLDAAKVEVERAWRALDAESLALQQERERIDATAADLGEDAPPDELAALRRSQAGYNARLASARERERALRRRTDDLNRQLEAYNARVTAARSAQR